MIDQEKYYVFYDGDCSFCNGWVNWILKNDHENKFLFSSLQSKFGQEFLKDRGLEHQNFETIYLWKPNSYYFNKSQAVFHIAQILGGFYAVVGHMNFLPRFITDSFYNIIARNRMRFSSQKCLVPTSEDRKKFIE